MSVRLAPLDKVGREAVLEETRHELAEGMVRVGDWSPEAARERAEKLVAAVLTEGPNAAEQSFFAILSEPGGPPVGDLWVETGTDSDPHRATINLIRIAPEFRRRGYARAALGALETYLRERGVRIVGLHAFGDNASANRLYSVAGFRPAHIEWRRDL